MSGSSPQSINQRIELFQKYLVEKQIDLAILTKNSDIYYYTGSVQPLYLLIPAAGKPLILARKAINRIQEEVPAIQLEMFYGGKDLAEIISRYQLSSIKRLGLALDVTSYTTVTRFQSLFPNAELADLSWDIRTLRMVKYPEEIEIQRKAGAIMARWPKLLKEHFRPGMNELQLSAVIENDFRLHGHGTMIRCRREGIEVAGFGVCSSGTNSLAGTKFDGICTGSGISPATPYGANLTPIQKGVPVILDYAFVLDGYVVDQTRMFSWGTPAPEVQKAYDTMCNIEEQIIQQMTPGTPMEAIYQNSLEQAEQMGYSEEFMGLGTEKVRFVGHGVGLELDEPPCLAPKMKDPLQEQMVIAIEPKVALPGIGIIGIEDTLVVRNQQPEHLTTCTKDFIIAE